MDRGSKLWRSCGAPPFIQYNTQLCVINLSFFQINRETHFQKWEAVKIFGRSLRKILFLEYDGPSLWPSMLSHNWIWIIFSFCAGRYWTYSFRIRINAMLNELWTHLVLISAFFFFFSWRRFCQIVIIKDLYVLLLKYQKMIMWISFKLFFYLIDKMKNVFIFFEHCVKYMQLVTEVKVFIFVEFSSIMT